MFTEEEILGRVRELGAEISGDYAGQVPVLVAILKGSVVFLADLLRSTILFRVVPSSSWRTSSTPA
jgi:hypoxanthine phosphoribosyltransferase